MKLYETTFVLDPELKDDGWEAAVGKYSGIITQAGTLKNVYRWGLRRMAYEIEKQSHGYYVHIIHESEPSVPLELERQFRLDESCLRYLTVLADNLKYLEEMEKVATQQVTESDSPRPESQGESVAADTPPSESQGEPVAADTPPQETAPGADSEDSEKREAQ